MSQPWHRESSPSRQQGHGYTSSFDSRVSGIADSSISFSQFPQPPSSFPTTPTQSEFNPPSPLHTHGAPPFTTPLVPLRRAEEPASSAYSDHTSRPGPSNASDSSRSGYSRSTGTVIGYSNRKKATSPEPPSPYSRTFSPHDWHEGASSIDVDATEDRLLSTSFITGLLRENSGSGPSNEKRQSFASDAFSGMSEMTYPPVARERPPLPPTPPTTALRNVYQRPQGARPPPSSFYVIPESSGQTSDDDTLYSNHENLQPSVVRTASRNNLSGQHRASAVGVAPATTLRAVSGYSKQDPTSTRGYSYASGPPEYEANGHKNSFSDYDPAYSVVQSSMAQPSIAETTSRLVQEVPRHTENRQSVHSTKSYAPSFISKISSTRRAIVRAMSRRRKPLPPVPVIPHIPIAAEAEHRRGEASVPLPDLIARAGTLGGLLEKGYHPHRSLNSYYQGKDVHDEGATSAWGTEVKEDDSALTSRRQQRGLMTPHAWGGEPEPTTPTKARDAWSPKKRRLVIMICVFIIIALAAVGAGVGVALSRKSPAATPACSAGLTGSACNLNATCVCTSSVSGRCDSLAQNLVDLTPTMNQLFDTNYTANSVYNSIWYAQGSPAGSTCASQSGLVDVASGISSVNSPNRTQWAQSALLWNVVQSQDVTATAALRSFVVSAPWSTLGDVDGPVSNPPASFSTSASGFNFDFAAQTITQPSVAFVSNGQPTNAQISRVGDTARNALDRMYSYALASSTQRQGALSSYWSNVLQQRPSDLSVFLSAISSSPLLIPFDAASSNTQSQALRALWNTPSDPFPPPPACYPNLNATQLQQLDDTETAMFGLSPVTTATQFSTSCYPDRPMYGVLDVLRLRLPFIDSRTGVATQAVTLNREVSPRAVIRNGEALSAFPGVSNTSTIVLTQAGPRQYGTLNHLNHVVLEYLMSITDVNVAMALVSYVLSSKAGPPANTSILATSLASIPALEVAIFGSVLPSDISTVLSSFATPSGSLLFGSSAGDALRSWAITGMGHPVIWADSVTSALVAQDSSLTDETFQEIWKSAATAIANKVSNVGVGNITASLGSTGKLSS